MLNIKAFGAVLLLGAALQVVATNGAAAGVLTLTGDQLVGAPGVTFPNTQPTVSGTSLFIGPGNLPGVNEKMMAVHLTDDGQALVSVKIIANMTRLTDDWDPYFMITNGATMIGINIADNDNGNMTSVIRDDAGLYGTGGGSFSTFITDNTYPPVGGSFTITTTFDFLAGSVVATSAYFSKSGQYEFVGLFDVANPIDFVLLRDNEPDEQFQINSLSIETVERVSVPEPWTVAMLVCGLTVLGAVQGHRLKPMRRQVA